MSEAADLIDRQIAAYRNRDLDAFLSCYADDVKVRDFAGNVMMDGKDGMRPMYDALFSGSPELGVKIANRVEAMDYVVDEEHITGFIMAGFPPEFQAGVVYKVRDGLIGDVVFLT